MDTAERIKLAKEKVDRLVNATLNVMRQRASNEIVLYTDAISKQVGRSYAAHAYISLQRSMFEHEFIRLCAMWDVARHEREARDRDSIPAVLHLIDDENVIRQLVAETRSAHLNQGVRNLNAAEDEETQKLIDAAIARHRAKFAEEQACKAQKWLADAIELGRQTSQGKILKSARHFRDHVIAHVLSHELEKARAPERLAKYGDEKTLFEITLKVVGWLHLGVSGASFAWDMARQNEKRYAEAFWHGVTVKVVE
jgi:AbiU2